MSSNMAIPAVNIGGNIVQPTPDGKFKVQTAKGKIKVLSQDQFEKQIKKNAANIQAGKDFEIKKGMSTTAKIIGFLAGAGAIVAVVVYRKDFAKWFQKATQKITEAAKGNSKQNNTIFSDTAGFTTKGKEAKNEAIVAMSKDNFGYELEKTQRTKMKADAKHAFENYDGEAVLKGLKEGKKPEELGLMVKEVKPQIKDPEKMVSLKDVPNVEPASTTVKPKVETTTAEAPKAKPKKKAAKKAAATETQTAEAAPKSEAKPKKKATKAEQPKADDNKKA